MLRKYSEMPTFLRKVGTPSDPAAPGFARIHRATSPINGGGKRFCTALSGHHFTEYSLGAPWAPKMRQLPTPSRRRMALRWAAQSWGSESTEVIKMGA